MPLALQGGLKDEIVAAIAEGRRPAAMADDEEAIYQLWDEVQRNQGASDATYANARWTRSASRGSSTCSASPATTPCWRW